MLFAGGEVQTSLNILIIHIYTKYTIWFDCSFLYGNMRNMLFLIFYDILYRIVQVKQYRRRAVKQPGQKDLSGLTVRGLLLGALSIPGLMLPA